LSKKTYFERLKFRKHISPGTEASRKSQYLIRVPGTTGRG
jgi:hypothetical protein